MKKLSNEMLIDNYYFLRLKNNILQVPENLEEMKDLESLYREEILSRMQGESTC
jgi:hypothetical protein